MPAIPNAAAGGGAETSDGREAIRKLKSTDAPLYLSPSPDLSETARLASEYLFSSLKPYAPKCPFTHLLVKGFDAEQIWQQIDLQSEPLISSLQRKVQKFEKNPEEIKNWFSFLGNEKPVEEKREDLAVEGESEDFDDEEITAFADANGDDNEDDDDDEEEEEEEEEEEGEDEEGEGKAGGDGVEDKFLKIDELEEYLEKDEAREYGLKRETKKGKKGGRGKFDDEEGDEEESEEGEDDEDDDELGVMGLDDDDDDDAGNARYEDFFGAKGKNIKKKKSESAHLSDGLGMNEQFSDGDNNPKKRKLSTHEKELERLRSTIEQMEKANIEPKAWTMQGEVTAVKRPKNSALEVDFDFEHNVRPPPVITEEVTASLEELIQKRIIEGHFDDVQKPPTLPSRAPREVKELDENKSKKGLGEIYEEEYAEKTGLVSVAMSISDQQKKEAKVLFKELCLKLDALSHFHFTPKPVIEDMAIQTNVPALAMEEIAPLAVSDAAMLAPEEVFTGKGDVKEETELNQTDRKRRRAKKKRKFKAIEAKRMARTQQIPQPNKDANES